MGNYQGYQKYKDSGVEWLGDIPEHWEASKAKFVSDIFIPQRNKPELNLDDGLPWLTMDDMLGDRVSQTKFKVTKEASIKAGSKSLKKGSVIASCIGNFSVCAINDVDVIINQQLQAFIPNSHIIPEYLRELVKISSDYFQMIATAATVVYVNQAGFANMPISLPPLNEQEKIAQFLDYKAKQIDELIKKKETLIEKLDEKRTAIISHAVTKGLDSSVPIKDSGVEWLGDIPKHWEVKRTKFLVSKIGSGKTPKGGSEVYIDSGIMLIRSQNVYDDGFRLDDVVYIDDGIDNIQANSRVFPNDILLNITGASIGRVSLVPSDFGKANVNQHVCIFRPKLKEIFPQYLYLLFCSRQGKAQIFSYETGISREGLNFQEAGNFNFAIPPVEEQKQIAEYLDQKTTQIDQQKAKIQEAIELLKEYRTSLITNAVTGKIDVSQIAIPSPQKPQPQKG